jgi:type IV secretion system protein VirD4
VLVAVSHRRFFAVAENSQAEIKPILNAWQSALVTALVMVVLFYLAEHGLHAFWQNGWLGNEDIYLLVVIGAFGVCYLIGVCLPPSAPPLPEQKQFGDAHWATLEETQLHTALLSGNEGIPLGYARDKADEAHQHWRKLSYSGDRHLVTVAPNRSGKGTTAIIPTLLEYDASCFVLDPKGENAAITARQRQRMGHKVLILNPFRELEAEFVARDFPEPDRFNPLATLDPTARNFVASAARLAEALVYNESKDPHWSDSARSLVECLLLYVCIEPDETRSLGRVRELLTDNPDQLKQLLARMATSSYRPLRQKVGPRHYQ